MLSKNEKKKEISGKLKALFPKASENGREQLLNLLVDCCCIDLCSLPSGSHVPVTTTNKSITFTQSGTDNQTITADITGITTATVGQIPSTDGAGNVVWTTPTSSTADNGLTETLGNIQLGGTLLHDTTVTQGSNKLVFERFALELTNTTKSILGLTDVNFVGEYTEDATNFGSGVTAYFFNGVLSDGSGNTAVVIGKETVGGTYTRTTQILAGNEVMTISTDGNVTTTVEISTNTGFLTNVSDISGSATSIEHSTNRWMASIVGTGYQHSVQLLPQGLLYSNGNLPSSYLFPTADGANGEVMMTNGLGVVSFQPTTNIVANEWHTTGNAGTDGGTTNFLGTTDAQDLVFKTNGLTIAQFSDNASQPSTGSIVFGSDDATYGTVSTASGSNTIAMGINNVVTGDLCFVGGLNNTVSNNGNTCFGAGNIVSGLANSLCVGIDNIVSGDLATSLGARNTIGATGGFACGNGGVLDNTASYGCVFNTENTAKGLFSAAFGISNTTYSVAEIVFGGFNTAYTPIGSTNIWQPADRLFTIGNGTSGAARNNALTMWKDGRSMWNGDIAKTNTWIGVNGTLPQNFINVTTPTGALAAISTEHTTSGNYAVLGSNAGNSGLAINNTRQFAFTTTAGTTSTQLGATTTVGNYSSTGFLFGGGGVATSTVDVNGSFATNILSDNTAALTLTNIHRTIINTGAATTYTLPVASTCRGREYVIANHGTGDITFATAITVANGVTITTLSNVAGTNNITIQSDGTTWVKTSN